MNLSYHKTEKFTILNPKFVALYKIEKHARLDQFFT